MTRISPDNWVYDQALLDRPGNNDIQLDLFYDYRTNLPLYPAVQAYFRKYRPPALIVWGKNDVIFPADVGLCADVAGRGNAATTVPSPGYVTTNISPANPNALEVHTLAKDGSAEDADFHLLVVC